jgi:hypothetical protein
MAAAVDRDKKGTLKQPVFSPTYRHVSDHLYFLS